MTDIEICNYALSLLGNGLSIASFTENTAESAMCGRVYNMVRQNLLTDYPWNFAVKQAALTAVTDETNEEYAYVYEYPSDCLRIVRLFPCADGEAIDYRLIYTLDGTANVRRIVTDLGDAHAEYILDLSDESVYPPAFCKALAYALAVELSMPLTSEARIMQAVQQGQLAALERAKYLMAREQRQPINQGNRYITARR